MALGPKPSQTASDCKIKRVNPAVRSVSTPRWTKDLPVVGPVNSGRATQAPSEWSCTSDWSPARLTERLRTELTPSAWKRLAGAAASHQTSVEQLLQSCLSEVA
jgi:hypothetical protein